MLNNDRRSRRQYRADPLQQPMPTVPANGGHMTMLLSFRTMNLGAIVRCFTIPDSRISRHDTVPAP